MSKGHPCPRPECTPATCDTFVPYHMVKLVAAMRGLFPRHVKPCHCSELLCGEPLREVQLVPPRHAKTMSLERRRRVMRSGAPRRRSTRVKP